MKPTLQNLGMTDEWLRNAADKLGKDADRNEGSNSALYKLGHGSADQKELFRRSYTDPNFMAKVYCRPYSTVVTLTITQVWRSPFSMMMGVALSFRRTLRASSCCLGKWKAGMQLWKPSTRTSRWLWPQSCLRKATNRERISGRGLDLALAWVVMDAIKSDWNLSDVKAHASEALMKVGNVYKILSADINPYHDVTFGIYVKSGKGKGEKKTSTSS